MCVGLSSIFACPLCCHSTVDMTQQWLSLDAEVAATQMPEEYRDVTVWILCRDCHKVVSDLSLCLFLSTTFFNIIQVQ